MAADGRKGHIRSSSSKSYGSSNSSKYNIGNPYVSVSPTEGSAGKGPVSNLFKVLGRCGKKVEKSVKKAGKRASNVWSHLKTSPSFATAAMAKFSQGTKVLAEGGKDKVFFRTFGALTGEKLGKSFACYLSTSSGPVIGTLYLSTLRVAFCSDNPISKGHEESIYYKVILPINHLEVVNPSSNPKNSAEKYIHVITVDGHEFWFMGFVSYDKAFKNLTQALQHASHHE